MSSTPAVISWFWIEATVTVKTPPLPPWAKFAQLPLQYASPPSGSRGTATAVTPHPPLPLPEQRAHLFAS